MPDPDPSKDKQPTADDIKALQSTYDRAMAAKDKEIAELKKAGSKSVVEDDISKDEESKARADALAKERQALDSDKVAWYRVKTVSDYRLGEADRKEIDKLTDPRDMELYALRKVAATAPKSGAGADREPGQTLQGQSASERLRSGLEARFKKLYPDS